MRTKSRAVWSRMQGRERSSRMDDSPMRTIPDGAPVVDLKLRIDTPWNPLEVFLEAFEIFKSQGDGKMRQNLRETNKTRKQASDTLTSS